MSSAQTPISVEYLLSEESFSEIENAKAWLEALATQSIIEARRRSAAETQGHPYSDVPSVARALEEISARAEEFRGTAQEFRLRNEQFILLEKSGRRSEWLDVYLDLLYTYPTHSFCAEWGARALRIAGELHRTRELKEGWRHAAGIPRQFESKAVLRELLEEAAGDLATQQRRIRPVQGG